MKLKGGASGEGKLACPDCGAKLGRFALTTPLVCSCGRAGAAPSFRIGKQRVDLLVTGEAADALAAMQLGSSDDSDDGDDMMGMAKKKRSKKKKIVRAHKGNFSSFRNKST